MWVLTFGPMVVPTSIVALAVAMMVAAPGAVHEPASGLTIVKPLAGERG